MKSKEELQTDKNKYKAIKEQLEKITPKLSTASKSIGSVDHEIRATYKVDGNDPKISEKTTKLKECIDTVKSNISLIIIPALEGATQAADIAIQNIEIEEAEAERQAAEAAAAAEAEQTTTPQTNPRPVHPATGYNRVRYTGVQE